MKSGGMPIFVTFVEGNALTEQQQKDCLKIKWSSLRFESPRKERFNRELVIYRKRHVASRQGYEMIVLTLYSKIGFIKLKSFISVVSPSVKLVVIVLCL